MDFSGFAWQLPSPCLKPAGSSTGSLIGSRRVEDGIHKYLAIFIPQRKHLKFFDRFRRSLLSAGDHEFSYGSAPQFGGTLDETLLLRCDSGLEPLLFAS